MPVGPRHPKQTRNKGWERLARKPVLYCGQPEATATAALLPSARARRPSPAASHRSAAGSLGPAGQGLRMQVEGSVELDGAAVVLTVLALLLRGAHEAAEEVAWKQKTVRGRGPPPRDPAFHGTALVPRTPGHSCCGVSPKEARRAQAALRDTAQPPRRSQGPSSRELQVTGTGSRPDASKFQSPHFVKCQLPSPVGADTADNVPFYFDLYPKRNDRVNTNSSSKSPRKPATRAHARGDMTHAPDGRQGGRSL